MSEAFYNHVISRLISESNITKVARGWVRSAKSADVCCGVRQLVMLHIMAV